MSEVTREEGGPLDTNLVRSLREDDLDSIVRIDAALVGQSRREYYRDRVSAALRSSRLQTSLVAEHAGTVAGFLLATLYYGEFGRMEPTAVIDSLGVHPELRRARIGEALMRQFLMNARALGVERVRTDVAWNDTSLIAFFDRNGFSPAGRIVLERALDDDRRSPT